jgi:hypothetical protein
MALEIGGFFNYASIRCLKSFEIFLNYLERRIRDSSGRDLKHVRKILKETSNSSYSFPLPVESELEFIYNRIHELEIDDFTSDNSPDAESQGSSGTSQANGKENRTISDIKDDTTRPIKRLKRGITATERVQAGLRMWTEKFTEAPCENFFLESLPTAQKQMYRYKTNCGISGCSSTVTVTIDDKNWLRLDNYKVHLKTKHSTVASEADLVQIHRNNPDETLKISQTDSDVADITFEEISPASKSLRDEAPSEDEDLFHVSQEL